VVEYYSVRTSRATDDFTFYLVFGLFRLAVIVQQIYFRYRNGQSSNPRFAVFGQLVNYLQQRSERHIEHGW
jgi:aminoglycoside phosphotransferase (APT) family kinase protein